MSGNYPPGTGPGDPNAPWNAPDPPECPECGHLIGTADDHAEDCPTPDLTQEGIADRLNEPSRTWDDVKEDPTDREAERYNLEKHGERLQESYERDPDTPDPDE